MPKSKISKSIKYIDITGDSAVEGVEPNPTRCDIDGRYVPVLPTAPKDLQGLFSRLVGPKKKRNADFRIR